MAALLLKQPPLAGEEAEIFVIERLQLGSAVISARQRP